MKIATMDEVIEAHLRWTLECLGWNKTKTADALKLDRRTVHRMIERFGLPSSAALAPELAAPVMVRCTECGSESEAGEGEIEILHTHDCPFAEAEAVQ